jgi:hypothetical protein
VQAANRSLEAVAHRMNLVTRRKLQTGHFFFRKNLKVKAMPRGVVRIDFWDNDFRNSELRRSRSDL